MASPPAAVILSVADLLNRWAEIFSFFVAAARCFAVTGANAAAQPLSRAILFYATMDIADVHVRVTCRRRSTSALGRNCLSAANVAFTSETGLFEPKLLVRMS